MCAVYENRLGVQQYEYSDGSAVVQEQCMRTVHEYSA
jgi:hypothetical protein